MDNKTFAKELEKRTRKFAIRIINLSAKLTNTPEGRVVRNQITKAGTSIGANYREANRARSRADFKKKICESETSETQFWLDLISDMKWITGKELISISTECSELLALFTKIGYNLK